MIHLKYGVAGGELHRFPGPPYKWVLEPIKHEPSLETKTTKLKLSYFGQVMRRHVSLVKTIILER